MTVMGEGHALVDVDGPFHFVRYRDEGISAGDGGIFVSEK